MSNPSVPIRERAAALAEVYERVPCGSGTLGDTITQAASHGLSFVVVPFESLEALAAGIRELSDAVAQGAITKLDPAYTGYGGVAIPAQETQAQEPATERITISLDRLDEALADAAGQMEPKPERPQRPSPLD